jgi:hypothetical protein
VSYECRDLAKEAAAALKAQRFADAPRDRTSSTRPILDPQSRTEKFILAWACWRNGLNHLADQWYFEAASTPANGDSASQPLRNLVMEELAEQEMCFAMVAFADPSVSRSEILHRLDHIIKHYGTTLYHRPAQESAILLRKMIKEDAEHAAWLASYPNAQNDSTGRVTELIFQLREQNGEQLYCPGKCDIFVTLLGKKDTPAHQLVKLGYAAVPQLIEHLDDDRFTRSVDCQRPYFFSHSVLRIQDCVLAILERITGRRFWKSPYISYMSQDTLACVETKKKAQAWYAEYQTKGEKAMLIQDVESGTVDSPAQARLLVESDPTSALSAIVRGMKAATLDRIRAELVKVTADIKNDSPLPFLLDELEDGACIQGRLAAARCLQARGKPEGVQAMIALWQQQWSETDIESLPTSEDLETDLQFIAEFLAGSGKVEAIDALRHNLRLRSLRLRLAIASSFVEGDGVTILLGDGQGLPAHADKGPSEQPEEVRLAIIELLMVLLDDTEQEKGMSGFWYGKNFSDPRICDIAAFALNRLDASKYVFDLSAPGDQRDREIRLIKDASRKARLHPRTPTNKEGS